MKYNFWLTLLLLVKVTSSFLIMQAILTQMQELVKEVTLQNRTNNGLAILLGIKLSP